MAVVIRLARTGRRKSPSYRIVAADKRKCRDGQFLEILGHYNPHGTPQEAVVKRERVAYWVSQGAVPSERVAKLVAGAPISAP